ncbi:hypothetical protein O6H91_15G070500 [Diphasiastrum complanatum]|uniref:Uncharacterized protein n=2 Tax=Diphasiastrum complanatum TaxID=34168 RepID=A0ACC2BJG4_DIPCM|nr:hypothetical protein O6H91_15G070500 [Diphasiastrum complanatum]KAJ7529902.1 hypothetical protein O6H91_15G070500 [Diphasiastrum complanatum]
MAMCSKAGLAGSIYGTLTAAIAPLLLLHLKWRRLKGLEDAQEWRQRLGSASIPRPTGPLFWFHAVSVGEGLSAIPVIQKCLQARPWVTILMTTSTVTAFIVLKRTLPHGVLCQFAPIDTPTAVNRFLSHWQPQAAVFMENELWPNLLCTSAVKGIPLALLNARMSSKSFKRWSFHAARPLVATMLANFSLICPLSTAEGVRLQLLGAPPTNIHFAGNLKYAWGVFNFDGVRKLEETLIKELSGRKVWLAASTHAGEEEVIARIHKNVRQDIKELLTVIVPRHPKRGYKIQRDLSKPGLSVVLRSLQEHIQAETDIYVVDTIGELQQFYGLTPIAFVGGSLLNGLSGHNMAEAAACGCAVLTGPHIGHFSKMVGEMQRHSQLSIEQVSGEDELQHVLKELLSDPVFLKRRQEAAKYALTCAAVGVVETVWKLLEQYVLRSVFSPALV